MEHDYRLAIEGINHHAVHISGPKEVARAIAASFSTSDVVHFDLEALGIDESREIGIASAQGPRTGSSRFIIVSFVRATLEAQNALLKTLEDPPLSTRFILISPDYSSLIDTVRSRLYALSPQASPASEHDGLLGMTAAERFSSVEKAIEEKDFAALRGAVVATLAQSSKLPTNKARELRQLANQVLTELSGRSPSPKLLMEYFTLRLPKVGTA